MTPSERRRNVGAIILASLGVTLLVTSAVIEIVGEITNRDFEIPHTVLYIGMLLGFAGFYRIDPKQATGGGQFVVDTFVRVATVLRGRRASDAVAVVRPEDVKEPPKEGG